MAQYIKDPLMRAQADELTRKMDVLLPSLMERYGLTQASLNAKIGGKHKEFVNTTTTRVSNPDHFLALWYKGLTEHIETKVINKAISPYCELHRWLKNDPEFEEYAESLLHRTYLRNFHALSRRRPNKSEGAVWIGENNADYGLLITPRFVQGHWENDESEIRHFPRLYWTIGHILHTGLVLPGKEERYSFNSVEAYLSFFKNVLVRKSGSRYEDEIAQMYCDFVAQSPDPFSVPLLIPQLRYEPDKARHRYRLDFTIINPYTLSKVGFELSPASSHTYIKGTEGMTAGQINAVAAENFEKEVRKYNDYFSTYGIHIIFFTGENLSDMAGAFETIKAYLTPKKEYAEQYANEKAACLSKTF